MAELKTSNKVQPESKQCRVCLENAGIVPIFGDANNPDLSNDLNNIGGVIVRKEDDFPKFICNKCFTLLESAVCFRKTAIRSDRLLKKRTKDIHQFAVKTENSEIIIFPITEYSNETIFVGKNLLPQSETNYENDSSEIKTEHAEYLDFDVHEDDVDLMTMSKKKLNKEHVKCDDCDMTFQTADLLELHKLTAPHMLSYMNRIDKKDSTIKKKVKGRSKIPETATAIKCEFCKKYYSTKGSYRKHLRDDHKVYPSCKTKQCPKCKKMFRPDYIGRHIKLVHAVDKKMRYKKPYTCDICHKNFTENMYPRHLREVHKIKPNVPTKTKECPVCKKIFRPDYIARHMKTIHEGERKPEIRIECPICKNIVNQNYYQVHLKKHSEGKKEYICDVCGKEFIFLSSLINHKTIHTTALPFKCEHCPYKGRNKHLLRIHTRTHTGDYPYKCDHCSTRCITKSNLNRHMQRHGPANFLCDSCNRGFNSKLDLEQHISAVHLGIKNHICNLCSAAFGYKHGLAKHMRRVHKIKKGRNALYLKLQQTDVPPIQQESGSMTIYADLLK